MTDAASCLQRKLRTAAALVIVGLLVEAITLHWSNPTSFIFFIGAGASLVGVGIVIYLTAIVRR